MKLTHEQLCDWFFTANPNFGPEALAHWVAPLKTPPTDTTRSEIVSGMKQGINDTLTKAGWLSDPERKKIDQALAVKGLPSLRKMEAILKKKHQRILKRGEFDVSNADRVTLEKISAAYEAKAK